MIFSLFLLTGLLGSVLGQSQRITLYDRAGCTGYYLSVVEDDLPELGQYNFNDRAISAKVQGTWIFYDSSRYGSGTTEYSFNRNGGCVTLRDNLTSRKASSMRYVGNPRDASISSLNLYEGSYFTGMELSAAKDLPVISLGAGPGSLIVTGTQDWSVFDQPWFGGKATCVSPNRRSEPFFDPETSKNLNYVIKSAKKGCKT